eukprot:12980782-Ditylum_brightwellii.AAC.1
MRGRLALCGLVMALWSVPPKALGGTSVMIYATALIVQPQFSMAHTMETVLAKDVNPECLALTWMWDTVDGETEAPANCYVKVRRGDAML